MTEALAIAGWWPGRFGGMRPHAGPTVAAPIQCQGFAGQEVGITEEEVGIWQVSLLQNEIGYFDLDTCRVEPVDNPFGSRVNDVAGIKCKPCDWYAP